MPAPGLFDNVSKDTSFARMLVNMERESSRSRVAESDFTKRDDGTLKSEDTEDTDTTTTALTKISPTPAVRTLTAEEEQRIRSETAATVQKLHDAAACRETAEERARRRAAEQKEREGQRFLRCSFDASSLSFSTSPSSGLGGETVDTFLKREKFKDMNERSRRGFPLHVAVQRGNAAMVEKLLDAKADPTSRALFGLTPLAFARKQDVNGSHAQVIEILASAAGAQPDG